MLVDWVGRRILSMTAPLNSLNRSDLNCCTRMSLSPQSRMIVRFLLAVMT